MSDATSSKARAPTLFATGEFYPDGTFTFVSSDIGTVVSMTLSVDGQSVPVPDTAGTGTAFTGSGTYVCEEDKLTVTTDGALAPFVMTRAR